MQECNKAELEGISANENILRISSEIGRRPNPGRVWQHFDRFDNGNRRAGSVNGKRSAFGLPQLVQA
ncbi:hypothetical protein PAT3040_01702 [Paenibacillus agaridevorans]|uniref:Uncharacterized protein n=1 Tax=Paenibacillus agaridevorans TaxID=171404 RepID=A0A2R5EUW1_9BACL|nr:hypothetical protein PAT3040_01702 [Paenibacillus agaridevorans]